MINSILNTYSNIYEKGSIAAAGAKKFYTDNRPAIVKTALLATATVGSYLAFHRGTNLILSSPHSEVICPEKGTCPSHPWEPDLGQCNKWDIWDCETVVSPSLFKLFVDGTQAYVNQMPPVAKAAAVATGGLVVKKAVEIAGKLSNWVISPEETSNAWIKAVKGAAHYPLAVIAGHTMVAAGSLANLIPLNAIEALLTNSNVPNPKQVMIPVLQMINTGVAFEEFLFRVVLQDLIFKKGVSSFLELCSPRLAEANRNHTAAKIVRVVLSSLLFSALHLQNAPMAGDAINYQLANTFGLGLLCGYLQEKTGDGWASIGTHAAFNNLQTIHLLQNSI